MIQRDAFHAISDPTRRRILASIAHNPLNVTTITEQFDVTRAAIYKHIKILEESGLLEITPNGRERFCAANLRKLSPGILVTQLSSAGKGPERIRPGQTR
jgi:DNA-binding transcriptional ArsR family regulator